MVFRSGCRVPDRSVTRDELELLLRARGGDRLAREELIEAFRPLMAGVARTYRSNPAVDRDELMQEGVVGLLRALGRYDVQLGTPFWAYASWWVRQAMQQLVAEMTRPVVLSDRALRRLARIKDARREYARVGAGEPSSADLAVATGSPREQVEQLLAAERAPRGLEEPLGVEQDGSVTFGELVVDPAAEDDYERVAHSADVEDLRGLCKGLGGRERGVVFSHYGLDGPTKTLREIADRLGLSVERVRQIEEAALTKLRGAFEAPDRERRRPSGLRELSPGDGPSAFREGLTRALAAEDVPAAEATDMLIAANEVACCAWCDGTGPELLRLGRMDGQLVCEIFARGFGSNGNGRVGLSIAGRLTERIEKITSEEGETVRLWL